MTAPITLHTLHTVEDLITFLLKVSPSATIHSEWPDGTLDNLEVMHFTEDDDPLQWLIFTHPDEWPASRHKTN